MNKLTLPDPVSPWAQPVDLPATVVARVFPFHFVAASDLRICQVGDSLGRIAPDAVPGANVASIFSMLPQRDPLNLEMIERRCDEFTRIVHQRSRIPFRGQFCSLEGGRFWAFLGGPWFSSADEVEAAGLTLNDFAPHDPIADLLLILQTQRIAMRDLQELAATLQAQRESSRRAEKLHRAAVAAANAVPYEEDFAGDRYTFLGQGIQQLTGDLGVPVTPAVMRSLIIETQPVLQTDTMAFSFANDGILHRNIDYRIRTPAGTERWISDSAVVVTGDNGLPSGAVGILQDVTSRRRFDRQLAQVSTELQAILQLIPGGVVAFNAEGTVSFCNPGFEQMTGLSADQVRGLTRGEFEAALAALCEPEDPAQPRPPRGPAAPRELMHLLRPRDAYIARSTSERNDSGDAGGVYVLYLRDVTRETEVDRMKSEFLAVAAHELRTPMSSVHGFAELLMMRQYDAETTRTIAGTIHRQSSALVGMVNELLDLARIEAGKGRDFVIEPVDLKVLLEEVVAGLIMPGDPRKVQMAPLAASPVVAADREKLRLAITNVLSNAYKYSRGRGEIRITVESAMATGAARLAGIRVADEGVGMSEEQRKRMFERFYRADPSGAIPGTGLGMTLVKDIIEIMRGEVDVVSQLGKGTIVTLWLPLAETRNSA